MIYHEARGETHAGKLAVAKVTLNRVKNKHFPNTVCGVIKQKNAYPWFSSKTPKQSPDYQEAKTLSNEILRAEQRGEKWYPKAVSKSLFFNTVPFKNRNLKHDAKIGDHHFYSMLRWN